MSDATPKPWPPEREARDEARADSRTISEGLVWLANKVMEATGCAPGGCVLDRQYVVDHVVALRERAERAEAERDEAQAQVANLRRGLELAKAQRDHAHEQPSRREEMLRLVCAQIAGGFGFDEVDRANFARDHLAALDRALDAAARDK